MNIAAAFRPAVHSTAQAGLKQGPSMQQGLTEDLCIMSAAGGLVRHRLTLQQHVQPEADPLRYVSHSLAHTQLVFNCPNI